jgi:hypothetical protein
MSDAIDNLQAALQRAWSVDRQWEDSPISPRRFVAQE